MIKRSSSNDASLPARDCKRAALSKITLHTPFLTVLEKAKADRNKIWRAQIENLIFAGVLEAGDGVIACELCAFTALFCFLRELCERWKICDCSEKRERETGIRER